MRLTSLPAQWMYLLDVIDAFETDDLKSAACCLAQAIHMSVLRLSVGCVPLSADLARVNITSGEVQDQPARCDFTNLSLVCERQAQMKRVTRCW